MKSLNISHQSRFRHSIFDTESRDFKLLDSGFRRNDSSGAFYEFIIIMIG